MKKTILFITLLAFVLSVSIVPVVTAKNFSGAVYDIKYEGSWKAGDSPEHMQLAVPAKKKTAKKPAKKHACLIQNFAYEQTMQGDDSSYMLLAKKAAKKTAKKPAKK